MGSREPLYPHHPTPPDDQPTSQEMAQIQGLVSRLVLLLPFGLALWALALAWGTAAPAKLLPLAISCCAVLSVGHSRPLLGGMLVVACTFAEAALARAWPGHWPLPTPLGALLASTFVLVAMELRSPRVRGGHILDSLYPAPGELWKLLVLALPVMLLGFFGLHQAL